MVVITLSEIIKLVVLAILLVAFILFFIISYIKNFIDRKFKHNCFECKHYYLRDVAGAGDCCWYRCKLNKEFDDEHSMNDRYKFRKCKEFEEKER